MASIHSESVTFFLFKNNRSHQFLNVRKGYPNLRTSLISNLMFGFALFYAFTSYAKPASIKLEGKIGNSGISMELNIDGTSFTGTYSYDRYKKPIAINGILQKRSTLELTEFGDPSKPTTATGTFFGRWRASKQSFTGTWHDPINTKHLRFHLHRPNLLNTETKNPIRLSDQHEYYCTSDNKPYADLDYQLMKEGKNDVIRSINDKIKALVRGQVYMDETKPCPPDRQVSGDTSVDAEIHQATTNLIFVKLHFTSSSGAHPTYSYFGQYFSLLTGKELHALDFFTSDGIDIANKLVTSEVKRNMSDIGDKCGIREESIDLFKYGTIELNKDYMFVYFSDMEVSAHVCSASDVQITMDRILPLLKPDSPFRN